MKRKLKKLARRLEQAGGKVVIPDDLPDDIAAVLLEELLNCPDCARELAARPEIPRSRREH